MTENAPGTLCWVYMSSPPRARTGNARASLPPDALYTDRDKLALVTATGADAGDPTPAGLTHASAAKDWHDKLGHQGGQVCGLVFLKAHRIPLVADILSATEEILHDYWDATRFSDSPYLTVEVVRAARLRSPQYVHLSATRVVPRSMFFPHDASVLGCTVGLRVGERPVNAGCAAGVAPRYCGACHARRCRR